MEEGKVFELENVYVLRHVTKIVEALKAFRLYWRFKEDSSPSRLALKKAQPGLLNTRLFSEITRKAAKLSFFLPPRRFRESFFSSVTKSKKAELNSQLEAGFLLKCLQMFDSKQKKLETRTKSFQLLCLSLSL